MNILLANSTCKVGGVSTFLMSLRSALVAAGHTCRLFFFERGSMEPYLPRDGSATFGTLADLLRLVAHERIDVVHANNVDWPTGISAVRRLGATLIVTAHKVREPAWTYGWSSLTCDGFASVSGWIARELQPFTDVPIQVVHNGVDVHRFSPDGDVAGGAPVVAWVGRGAAARKRLERFAGVAAALHAAGARIWIIDQQGPDAFAQIQPEAATRLRTVVERWEGVPAEGMPRLYREIAASAGCLVSTASMEGLPLTLLEAQACGCVVVAAGVRGVEECVSPEGGGVLYRGEAPASEIVQLLTETLRDRHALARRGATAAAFVRSRFSLERMAEQYIELYRAAPFPPVEAAAGVRYRASPLLHWRQYLDERLGVGYAQYEAFRALAERGDTRAAAAAARESLSTAPTMYARPERLAQLLRLGMAAGLDRAGVST